MIVLGRLFCASKHEMNDGMAACCTVLASLQTCRQFCGESCTERAAIGGQGMAVPMKDVELEARLSGKFNLA